jgi:hypothetical protein
MARKTPAEAAAGDGSAGATRPERPASTSRRRGRPAAEVDPSGPATAPENVVRPARRREAAPEVAAPPDATRPPSRPATTSQLTSASADAVPERVRDRFVQVGAQWHFPDGALAFTDRGRRLVTPSENAEVVRSLVEIAQARGWEAIAVSGTERFRKEAWAAGQLAGVIVKGYTATPFDKETLARTLARRREAAERPVDDVQPPRRQRDGEGSRPRRVAPDLRDGRVDGRLIEHGPAPYLHRPGEPQSYFVTVETLRGPRTVWGRDLERAMKESLTQPKAGDEVRLQVVAREPVTVKRLERGEDGRTLDMRTGTAQRNRWVAETPAFFEERAASARALRDPAVTPQSGVRERPELTGSYLVLKGAEEVASRKIRDPEDRAKFVALVRGALADAIERGEPLPTVRIRERSPQPERRSERDVERAR